MDLLLLDAAANAVRPIVRDATRAAGAFDPSAPRVALSTLNRLPNGTNESTLSLLDLDSGAETPLGPGFGVVWLQP